MLDIKDANGGMIQKGVNSINLDIMDQYDPAFMGLIKKLKEVAREMKKQDKLEKHITSLNIKIREEYLDGLEHTAQTKINI